MADINEFLAQGKSRWQRLGFLIEKADQKGIEGLTGSEVRELAQLYRATSSDLLRAQTQFENADAVAYLNTLIAGGYAHIYGRDRRHPKKLISFYRRDLPKHTRFWWPFLAAAAAFFLLGTGLGYTVGLIDSEALEYFMDANLLHMSQEEYLKGKGHDLGSMGASQQAYFASFLFTHNIKVGFWSFALGPTIAGTPCMTFYNGAFLGAFASRFSDPQHAWLFWSLILPHAGIEIFGLIFLSAAGLMLGHSVLFPGSVTTRAALRHAGKASFPFLVAGCTLLVFAGFLEAFVSPAKYLPIFIKYLIFIATVAGVIIYLVRGGRSKSKEKEPNSLGILLSGKIWESASNQAALDVDQNLIVDDPILKEKSEKLNRQMKEWGMMFGLGFIALAIGCISVKAYPGVLVFGFLGILMVGIFTPWKKIFGAKTTAS